MLISVFGDGPGVNAYFCKCLYHIKLLDCIKLLGFGLGMDLVYWTGLVIGC
jgi:hypothetical protein